jgi:hypothetical protein
VGFDLVHTKPLNRQLLLQQLESLITFGVPQPARKNDSGAVNVTFKGDDGNV